MSPWPTFLAHADWSATEAGRSLVLAERGRGRCTWWLEAADPIRVRELLAVPRGLVGFDAPIGLPEAYAAARGIVDFPSFLTGLGAGDPFFEPAAHSNEVCLARPFYPRRPGGARRVHLLEGLGLREPAQLLRRCDRLAGAASLFWTLGPKQCGRAALAIWRDLLRSARPAVALWPFDGPLAGSRAEARPIVAETYPGLAYRLLGLPRFAKSRASDRARLAGWLRERAAALDARLGPKLEAELEVGFPSGRDHGFDALLGCLLLLEIVEGRRGSGDPVPAEAARIEGWMLGLEVPASRR